MKQIWIQYFQNYPLGEVQDFIKLLYQSILGSAHLVVNVQDNFAYLKQEYKTITYDPTHVFYEDISEDLVRIHLEAIPEKYLSIMHTLFMKSVQIKEDKETLLEVFKEVEKGIEEGWIPFSMEMWQKEKKEYLKKGCPVVSHTPVFREHYHPHYRLMKKEYIKYLEILFKIQDLEKYSVIAIDGNAAAGKSSFASFLADLFHYPVVHMDDFFLQKKQRCEKRLQEPGGNIDYERFLKEVVLPLEKKKPFSYQIFDCSKMELDGFRDILYEDKVIVEGCYSHHPYFKNYATLKIFMEVEEEVQKQRILKRNGSVMLERFLKEWIVMENQYFTSFQIKENSDYIV